MAILSNAERLERIKGYWKYRTSTNDHVDDVKWLIKQAERAEKAEKLIDKLHRGLGMSVHIDRQLWLETDRYMKSLEETK